MAPTTKAKSVQAEAHDPNPELTTSSKSTFEHCSRRGPSVKSQDTETTYEDTANAAANVSAAPAEVPSPAPAVLPKWIVKRRRNACSESCRCMYTRRRKLPTNYELEVANGLLTEDDLEVAATMVQMKRDPNCFAAAQKESRCGASVRSEDTETAFEDTANAAGYVSAAPVDCIEPVDPRESAEVPSLGVLPKWIGRRRRSGLDELEVANFLVTQDFGSRWSASSMSDGILVVAVAHMVLMKWDRNCSPPAQKESRPKRNRTRRGRRS